MAVHPKITLFGLVVGGTVCFGLALFVLGRITVGANLGEMLVGVGIGIGILGAVGVALLKHLPASQQMEGMFLHHSQHAEDGYISATARTELVGKSGVAASELRPAGTAVIEGERVDVITEGDWMKAGTPVTVVKAEAMRLVVRRAPQLNA
jgi:membrane-bound serine protease (ClpP class)